MRLSHISPVTPGRQSLHQNGECSQHLFDLCWTGGLGSLIMSLGFIALVSQFKYLAVTSQCPKTNWPENATHIYFPAQTCSTKALLCVLTPWHHVHVERLGGVVLILVVAVTEDAVEYALVGSRVIEGHVEDVDGAVLQVPGVLAAVPVQAVVETWVNDLSYLIFIAV